jgi:hypothetical protein
MRANQCCTCGAEMSEGDQVCARCRRTAEDSLAIDFHCGADFHCVSETVPNSENAEPARTRCVWCGPGRIGWFSVQFWVRACYGKRKWMSVTRDWKHKVKFCPMCGAFLKERGKSNENPLSMQ